MNPLFSLILTLVPADVPKYDPDACARAVAPFVEGRTYGILRVDLTSLDAAALSKSALPIVGQEGAAQMRAGLTLVADLSKHGARELFIVLSLADTPGTPILVLPVNKDDAKKVAAAVRQFGGIGEEAIHEFDGYLVVADPMTAKRVRDRKPEARPEIARAFANAGPGFAQFVLVPTTDLPRILDELLPKLPPELGGESSKVVTRGFKSLAVAVEAKPALHLRLTIQADDADAAKALHALALKGLQLAANEREVQRTLPDIKRLVEQLTPKIDGDRLTLNLEEAMLVKALAQPADRVRAAAERAKSMNNLKQLGLALHSYHDTHRGFPAAANFDKGNKPLLSRRVQILPFIDQEALYKEFKLDEPWDSEHNKKLIEKMPPVFRSSTDEKLFKAGKTTYLAPRGKATMFPPGNKGVRVTDVTDGLSNTILLFDAADDKAVIWTKPDDLDIDVDNPAKGTSTRFETGFLILMADGSVRFVSSTVEKKVLWAMFTISGGEVLPE